MLKRKSYQNKYSATREGGAQGKAEQFGLFYLLNSQFLYYLINQLLLCTIRRGILKAFYMSLLIFPEMLFSGRRALVKSSNIIAPRERY